MDDNKLPQSSKPNKPFKPYLGPYNKSYNKQNVQADPARPVEPVNPIADIERQEKIDHLRAEEQMRATRQKPKSHKVLRFFGWMLLIVLLTTAGATAGWYFWLRNVPKTMPGTAEKAQQTVPAPAPKPAEVAEPVETHTSAAFQLQFDYPKTWKVVEAADNKITATSPATKLKTAAGSTQNGQIVMTIRFKQASLPEFKDGNARAVLESEKIAYAKPSQSQRASTYISFLKYAATTAKGVDGVYVTGDNGYQKDQDIPLTDIAKADPLITITFFSCADATCSPATRPPVALAPGAWQDAAFSKPLKDILQSIVVE